MNIVINLGIIGGLVFAVIVGFALADRIRGGGPISAFRSGEPEHALHDPTR